MFACVARTLSTSCWKKSSAEVFCNLLSFSFNEAISSSFRSIFSFKDFSFARESYKTEIDDCCTTSELHSSPVCYSTYESRTFSSVIFLAISWSSMVVFNRSISSKSSLLSDSCFSLAIDSSNCWTRADCSVNCDCRAAV